MNEQVAVVTGSSRGIGRAIAKKLAANGCKVVINCRTQLAEAEAVKREIEENGGSALVVQADVSKPEGAEHLISSCLDKWGRIDILVNNAGITHDQLLLRMSDEDWHKVLDSNLNAAFYCTRVALRTMVRQRYGRIVNISSVVGLSGNAGQAHYAAAKAALLGFTFSVAHEYGRRGITANAVAPGFIKTAMTAELKEQQVKDMLQSISVGRLGEPEDIAEAVAFFCSPQASYINAQVLRVDGGMKSL